MHNRRTFLKRAAALPLITGSGLTTLMGGQAAAADITGYKALVCVFLFGGMDNHDTVLPYDQTSYDGYADIRSSLLDNYAGQPGGSTRARDQLLPLNPSNASDFGTRQFALPPEMGALHTLFENGDAAIVGNVGPLIQPVTSTEFETGAVDVPKRLFSHNDQQSTWMAFQPEGAAFGWGGLFADAAVAANANTEPVFTAISLGGNTVFLSGQTVSSYEIGTGGVQQIALIDNNVVPLPDNLSTLLRNHFDSVGLNPANLFQQDVIDLTVRALAANDQFNDSIMGTPSPITTAFPQSGLGQQLRAVAETINIRTNLDAQRQVFFVATGGFDTHSGQAQTLPQLQQDIADSMAAFFAATQELGVASDVTAFTASDFGRTLTINGDGTDHGWGGHHFVVGEAVKGGAIYGGLPPYTLGHAQDAGNGRLIPTVAVEEYAAALGAWFGLNGTELAGALPNLSNFSGVDFV